MKKTAVVIDSKNAQNHKWSLFPLFLKKFSSTFQLTSSFVELESYNFIIFTNINDFIKKKINELDGLRYGFILDGKEDWSEHYKILSIADFVFCIFGDGGISKIKNVSVFNKISLDIEINKNNQEFLLTDEDDLNYIYQEFIDGNFESSKLSVLCKNNGVFIKDSQFFLEKFKNISVEVTPILTSPSVVESILTDEYTYYSKFEEGRSVFEGAEAGLSVQDLISQISKLIRVEEKSNITEKNIINIVCFRPTYLFLDLVRRFEKIGCVHSDFPIAGASAYIWMRPQEIWHYDFLLSNKNHKEISITYQRSFADASNKSTNFKELLARSVAIHHGTCFEPLYQFDYEKLAISLRKVNKVIGVCEFEECYGPSAAIANRENYSFVPIGYDAKLFNDFFAKKEALKPKSKLKIGFVGRAYGTNDKKQLSLSKLSEPKGYRKGGDIFLDILLRAKAMSIPFEVHILGQNWEELVEDFSKYGIDCVYYARDKNITYEKYPEIYSSMDALLITARCEGGPVSAIEALSLGVKVISTNVGVVQYLSGLFTDNKSCISVDYDKKWHIADKDTFINEINSLYINGRPLAEIQDCKNIVKKFTTDYWVNEIYENALSVLN